MRETWHDNVNVSLRWADAAARDLFGRPIPQILLLHVGAFDAVMIDDLLSQYEKLGVRFVSLDEALRDRIYTDPPPDTTSPGGGFLHQFRKARGTRTTPPPTQPAALLDALCR